MLCESPIRHGDRKGQLATGTAAGYQRHWQADEPPCDECRGFIHTNRPSWYDHAPLGSVDRVCGRCGTGYKSGPNRNYKFCPDCREIVRRGRSVGPRLRDKVIHRDNGVCLICQKMTDPNDFTVVAGSDGRPAFVAGPDYPSVDHITPQSVGGEHVMSNLRTAHHRCNAERSDALDEQLSWAV